MKIHSPAEGYTANDRYGDVVLEFKDGVAEFDGDLPAGIRQYLAGAGYGLGEDATAPEKPEAPADPRDIEDGTLGTKLRDAAVDPQPEDFLAPLNAGEGNPHGPEVVSPEIHASGPAGIKPGNVFVEDPEKQEAREKEYAQARLIDGATAAEANEAAVPDINDFGPLGLSDPGSVEQGAVETDTKPAKADNKAAWVDYAVEQGAEREEAEAMTKADLVERYS